MVGVVLCMFVLFPASVAFPHNALVELTQPRLPAFLGATSHTAFEQQLAARHGEVKHEVLHFLEHKAAAVPADLPKGFRIEAARGWRYKQLFCDGGFLPELKADFPILSALFRDAHEDVIHGAISIMEPHSVIPCHFGYLRGIYRILYPLKVPAKAGAAHITLDGVRHVYAEGSALVFDDNFQHRVVNDSDETRVVLFMDVRRRFAGRGFQLGNRAVTAVVGKVAAASNANNERASAGVSVSEGRKRKAQHDIRTKDGGGHPKDKTNLVHS